MLQSLSSWRAALVTSAERSDIEPVLLRAQVLGCFEVAIFATQSDNRSPRPILISLPLHVWNQCRRRI